MQIHACFLLFLLQCSSACFFSVCSTAPVPCHCFLLGILACQLSLRCTVGWLLITVTWTRQSENRIENIFSNTININYLSATILICFQIWTHWILWQLDTSSIINNLSQGKKLSFKLRRDGLQSRFLIIMLSCFYMHFIYLLLIQLYRQKDISLSHFSRCSKLKYQVKTSLCYRAKLCIIKS